MFPVLLQELVSQKASTRAKIEIENNNLLVNDHNGYTACLAEDKSFLMVFLSFKKLVSPEILL